jgi:hypothetical protein
MAFERFEQAGRSFQPKVTVTRYGMMSFNSGARQRFGMEAFTHAVLFYDKTTKRVGIRLTDNAGEPGARPLHMRRTGADLAAKPFLDYFDIDYGETRWYPCSKDEEENLVVFALKAGKVRGRRAPKLALQEGRAEPGAAEAGA